MGDLALLPLPRICPFADDREAGDAQARAAQGDCEPRPAHGHVVLAAAIDVRRIADLAALAVDYLIAPWVMPSMNWRCMNENRVRTGRVTAVAAARMMFVCGGKLGTDWSKAMPTLIVRSSGFWI